MSYGPGIVKAKIDGIAAGGAGVARIDGKSVFVEGGIPGETVVCRVLEERGSWARAETLEILEASQDRARPECPFYGRCGGCGLRHMGYEAQLAAKTAILKDSFVRIGGLVPPEPAVSPCVPREYRNRMQFHAFRGFDKNRPDAFCGLKARGSDEIVPVSDCPVADPGLRRLLSEGGSEARALFVSPGKDRVTVYSREGLLLSENGPSRGRTRILDGELLLDAGVFFQSNGAMLEKLLSDLTGIARGLGDAERSLPMADLYCGVGTFAAFLGGFFTGVDMVEGNKTALALAGENLAGNKSAKFYPGRIGDWAKNRALDGYGLAVVDPPRQGLDSALTRRLVEKGPRVLAYVSCNPATLARDCGTLIESYDIAELRWYDFYPHTAHIESLAVLIGRGGRP